MRKLAVVGLLGAAIAAGGSAMSYAEDLVVANLVIESASDVDAGYATNSARGVAIELFAQEAMSIPAVSAIPPEATVVPPKSEVAALVPVAPAVEQDVAAATTIVPTPRPDFEATQSMTSDVVPAKRVAQRSETKVVKVSAREEKKRITPGPLPVYIGAFR